MSVGKFSRFHSSLASLPRSYDLHCSKNIVLHNYEKGQHGSQSGREFFPRPLSVSAAGERCPYLAGYGKMENLTKTTATEIFNNLWLFHCVPLVKGERNIQVLKWWEQRKKLKYSRLCFHVPHKTLNLVISRCCFSRGTNFSDTLAKLLFFLI